MQDRERTLHPLQSMFELKVINFGCHVYIGMKFTDVNSNGLIAKGGLGKQFFQARRTGPTAENHTSSCSAFVREIGYPTPGDRAVTIIDMPGWERLSTKAGEAGDGLG